MVTLQSVLKEIRNKNGILERCIFVFLFLLVHWIDQSLIEHSCAYLLYLFYIIYYSLQCFDAVGWAVGRASGL